MAAKGIRAGAAYVEIFADDGPITRGLKGLEAKFKNFGGRVSSVGTSIAGIGAATSGLAASVIGPIGLATKQFTAFGDSIQKLGLRTAAPAEFLSELGFAAEQSGTDLKTVGDALFRMNRRVANAATGMGPAARAMELLGFNAKELSGLDTEQRFLAIADSLAAMEDQTLAAQLGFEIFGNNFKALSPLIQEGSSGINALRREAKQLGLSLSQADANAAAKLGDSFNRIARTGKAAFLELGAAVAPAVSRIADRIAVIVTRIVKWAKENRGLVLTVAGVATAIAGIGAAATSAGFVLIGLGSAISAIGAIAGTIGAAVGAILTPVGLIASGVVAIGGAIAYVANQAGLLQPVFRFLQESFGRVFKTASVAIGGIINALSSGQFGQAAGIAWAGVKLASLQGAQQVLRGIEGLWNNAGVITIKFLAQMQRAVFAAFKAIPRLAFAALQGGAAFQNAIKDSLGGFFSGEGDFLSRQLDPAIARAQSELNVRVGQVRPRANAAAIQRPPQGGGQVMADPRMLAMMQRQTRIQQQLLSAGGLQ